MYTVLSLSLSLSPSLPRCSSGTPDTSMWGLCSTWWPVYCWESSRIMLVSSSTALPCSPLWYVLRERRSERRSGRWGGATWGGGETRVETVCACMRCVRACVCVCVHIVVCVCWGVLFDGAGCAHMSVDMCVWESVCVCVCM